MTVNPEKEKEKNCHSFGPTLCYTCMHFKYILICWEIQDPFHDKITELCHCQDNCAHVGLERFVTYVFQRKVIN